jgi:hypothetical protein
VSDNCCSHSLLAAASSVDAIRLCMVIAQEDICGCSRRGAAANGLLIACAAACARRAFGRAEANPLLSFRAGA